MFIGVAESLISKWSLSQTGVSDSCEIIYRDCSALDSRKDFCLSVYSTVESMKRMENLSSLKKDDDYNADVFAGSKNSLKRNRHDVETSGSELELEDMRSCKFHPSLDYFQTSPLIEILQARHDMLYSRLFNS